MSWSPLATQFCFELAFGVLFALAFVPRAPVGVFFYRLMGTTAVLPLLLGVAGTASAEGLGTASVSGGLAILAYPVYSGPVRGRTWAAGLGVGLLGAGGALAAVLAGRLEAQGPGGFLVAAGTALATGAVAGSVGLAMVLGHWYLTVPKLAVSHLQRLNRVTIGAMAACLGLVALSCWVFRTPLAEAERSLFGPTGLFYLGTRLVVGLLMPLVFAAMAASSLRFRNTRSATGILYASTVLVLIGAAISISLQDSYGVPL